MNLFLFEFKKNRQSMIIWSLSIAGLIFMSMAMFPTFSKDASLMDMILANYPEELIKAFGMNTGLSLTSILGYLSFTFAFVQLCLAIQASNYGFSILSVEERDLTADFLMSKPISRSNIYLSKFFAVFINLLLTSLLVVLSLYVSIVIFGDGKEYDSHKLVVLLLTLPVFQLFFLSIGMFVSVIVKKIRNVLSFSMALAFGLYTLGALRSVLGGDVMGYFTPFYHFEAGYILEHAAYHLPFAWISVGVVCLCLSASYMIYKRRNIHSV